MDKLGDKRNFFQRIGDKVKGANLGQKALGLGASVALGLLTKSLFNQQNESSSSYAQGKYKPDWETKESPFDSNFYKFLQEREDGTLYT